MTLKNGISLAVTSTVLTLFVASLPAYAAEAEILSAAESANALSDQGHLKADTVAPEVADLALPTDSSDAVVLGPGSAEEVSIGLPNASLEKNGENVDGIEVYPSEVDDTSVLVNPTSTGVQLATVIGSPDSPSNYTYTVTGPANSELILDDQGGASIIDQDGNPLASIDTPWARDANGEEVPTSFELTGPNRLTQVVDHQTGDYAYPVTADPRVFTCDAGVAKCVKFTKTETRAIAKKVPASLSGLGPFIGTFCSKMPGGLYGSAGCAGLVGGVSYALAKSFASASKSGKCLEVHILRKPITLYRWKTESC